MEANSRLEALPEDVLIMMWRKLKIKDSYNCDLVSRMFHSLPWRPELVLHGNVEVALSSRRMVNLEKLSVRDCTVNPDVWRLLENFRSSLRWLALDMNHGDVDELLTIVNGFPRLSHLSLQNMSISLGSRTTAFSFPNLQVLSLDGIKHLTGKDIENLVNKAAPMLRSLRVYLDDPVHSLVTIEGPYLESLTWEHKGGMLKLVSCNRLESLRVTDLQRIEVESSCWSRLEEIFLDNIDTFNDEQLSDMLTACKSLKELTLMCCEAVESPVLVRCTTLETFHYFALLREDDVLQLDCSNLTDLKLYLGCSVVAEHPDNLHSLDIFHDMWWSQDQISNLLSTFRNLCSFGISMWRTNDGGQYPFDIATLLRQHSDLSLESISIFGFKPGDKHALEEFLGLVFTIYPSLTVVGVWANKEDVHVLEGITGCCKSSSSHGAYFFRD